MKTFYALNFKKAVTFFIFLLTLTAGLLAQTPQYYNYNTAVGNNAFPFSVVAGKQVQWLVLPGEFNQPGPAPSGNITKVWFYMGGTGSVTFTSLTIKMGDSTGLTTLPTGVIYTGRLDTVYYRASVALSSSTGSWMSITLDTPFPFNSAKSLVIDVSQCGVTATGLTVYQTTLTGFRRTYTNHSGSCVFVYSGQGAQIANCGVDVTIPPPTVCNYSWANQTSGTTAILYSVKGISNLVGWAAGAGAVIRRTTDGGTTWGNGNPNPGVVTGDVYAIEAFDANTAWCTTSPAATFIYRTTNGGANWTQVFTQAGGFIDDIKFNDANTGFAYGDPVSTRWSLWKTSNGGVTWDSTGLYLVQAGSEAGWNNAMNLMGNNIWFGTSNTRVYKSTNFGASWTFGATTGLVNSFNLHFNSATLGMVGGTTVLQTTDGGATYIAAGTPLGTGNINGFEGAGTDFWYVRGTGVYKTSNGGTTWTLVHTATGSLNDVDFGVDGNGCLVGWTVGAGGALAKMTGIPVGIGNNNNQIPGTYSLEQNYPNPFNPSTTIKFALPKSGLVELRIYDALGREAASILNEFRQAGNYRVEFIASNLASGVYFYTIKSGAFIDTKKMVLIK